MSSVVPNEIRFVIIPGGGGGRSRTFAAPLDGPKSGPGNIVLEWVMPFSIEQTRGTDPYEVVFATSDPNAFSMGNGTKGKFVVTTPGPNNKAVTHEWGIWHITQIEPHAGEPGLYLVHVMDERWRHGYNKITASYNIEWADGQMREDSLKGKSEWSCFDAAKDALEKFGFTLAKKHDQLNKDQKRRLLPRNLGNSVGGGFATASIDDVIPRMLEPIGADIIMNFDGEIEIVSRVEFDNSTKLADQNLIAGVVAEEDVSWLQPRSVVVEFENMVESVWEYKDEPLSKTTSGGKNKWDWKVENVMPKYNPDDWNDASEWEEIGKQVATTYVFGANVNTPRTARDFINKRYFKPEILPINVDTLTGSIVEPSFEQWIRKERISDLIRKFYRLCFRVSPESKKDNGTLNARSVSNLRLGRLGKQGENVNAGSVFMDHAVELRYGQSNALKTPTHPLQAVFSRNYLFTKLNQAPAPFDARWVVPDQLIFMLVPNAVSSERVRTVIPSALAESLNYGPIVELKADRPVRVTRYQGELANKHRMAVFWNGRVIRDIPELKLTRVTGIKNAAFQSGKINQLTLKCYDMTANYGISKAAFDSALSLGSGLQNLAPDTFLNEAEAEKRAKEITEQVKKSFEEKRAGIAVCAGVSALTKVHTGGAINSVSLKIGDGAPYAITTQFTVLPRVHGVELDRQKLDGEPPRKTQAGG